MIVDPIPEPEKPGLDTKSAEVIKRHMAALEDVCKQARKAQYPGHDHEFTVLYVGGGSYWPGIVVGCKLLRMMGYQGRIEVWHGHHANPEPVFPEDVEGLDVHIVNALKIGTKPRILRGWETKFHAIQHCRARKVFFLDADAYFVKPIDRIYNEFYGLTYWYETVQKINWDAVWGKMKRDVPSIQGGHFFIDREKCWPLVLVTDWLCQHSDFYFQHMWGDQDALKLALSILIETPFRVIDRVRWNKGVFWCPYKEEPVIIHRVRSKLFHPKDWNAKDCLYGHNPEFPMENIVYNIYSHICNKRCDIEDTFKVLHTKRRWVTDKSHDQWLAEQIAKYAARKKCLRIVDAGCGDGEFDEKLISLVRKNNPQASLIGIDCVPDVLPKGGHLNGLYQIGDVSKVEDLPPGDMLIAKDLLHHWSNDLVYRWLRDVVRMRKWRHLALVVSSNQNISDIPIGGFRGLDVKLFPLNDFAPWETIYYGHGKTLLFKSLD